MFILFILFVSGKDKYIYISNDGSDTNDGTYDHPLNSSNFVNIRESIRRLTESGVDDHVHFVFKEGTYKSDGWAMMGWDYPQEYIKNITFEGEEGKNVIIHGSEIITGWKKSNLEGIWEVYYPDEFTQMFVGDKRATICRLPKRWKNARPFGYEFYEDPSDPEKIIRKIYVQKDCIEMLRKMTKEELQYSELVIYYWWFVDVFKIYSYSISKNYVVVKVPKEREVEQKIFEGSYYFIRNSFSALTEPGEYYHHPNGTLYYLPRKDEDMNTVKVYIPTTSELFSFNNVGNLTFTNLKFYYTGNGFGGINFPNLHVYDCEFKHCNSSFYYQVGTNAVIEHCLIEDTAYDGMGFGGCENNVIRNCIIRTVGEVAPHGFGINFWSANNHTFILNNDISDGTGTLIFFGGGKSYDIENLCEVNIEHNHLHHGGYRIVDDLAAMFFGFFPRGAYLNHNKIHDMYANNYCGNGIYPDTGSSGTVVTNNLIYNLSHSAFNLNFGINHKVHNNIMAFCRNGFTFGSSLPNKEVMNVQHNIVYLDREDSYPAEGPFLEKEYINVFDHNLYFKNHPSKLTIMGKNMTEWQEFGFDKNSIVADPMFKDPEHGDFTFSSKENADKIGFQEFDMNFGVIGDEWRRLANDYTYHDPVVRTDNSPLIGDESFENGMDTYFLRRMNYDKNPKDFDVSITNKKSYSGSKSFKITRKSGDGGYIFNFPTLFKNGTCEFTFMMYIDDDNADFILDFGVGWIFLKDGQIKHIWDTVIGTYSNKKWFKIGVELNIAENPDFQNFTFILNDQRSVIKYDAKNFQSIDYVIISYYGKGTVYFDNIHSTTNHYIEPYFDNELMPNDHLENIDFEIENIKKKKKLSGGAIAGIVIGVVAFVAIIVCLTLYFLKRKNKDASSTALDA